MRCAGHTAAHPCGHAPRLAPTSLCLPPLRYPSLPPPPPPPLRPPSLSLQRARAWEAVSVCMYREVARISSRAECATHARRSFRPDYLSLGTLRASFPSVPILALTATASDNVRADVERTLGLDASRTVHFRGHFDRANLRYEVRHKPASDDALLDEMAAVASARGRAGCAGIVYTLSRADAERTAAGLSARGVRAAAYHAGCDGSVRHTVQVAWQDGRLQVVVATVAFGLGIDKVGAVCVWRVVRLSLAPLPTPSPIPSLPLPTPLPTRPPPLPPQHSPPPPHPPPAKKKTPTYTLSWPTLAPHIATHSPTSASSSTTPSPSPSKPTTRRAAARAAMDYPPRSSPGGGHRTFIASPASRARRPIAPPHSPHSTPSPTTVSARHSAAAHTSPHSSARP